MEVEININTIWLDLSEERFMSTFPHHRVGGCHMAEQQFCQAPSVSSDDKQWEGLNAVGLSIASCLGSCWAATASVSEYCVSM